MTVTVTVLDEMWAVLAAPDMLDAIDPKARPAWDRMLSARTAGAAEAAREAIDAAAEAAVLTRDTIRVTDAADFAADCAVKAIYAHGVAVAFDATLAADAAAHAANAAAYAADAALALHADAVRAETAHWARQAIHHARRAIAVHPRGDIVTILSRMWAELGSPAMLAAVPDGARPAWDRMLVERTPEAATAAANAAATSADAYAARVADAASHAVDLADRTAAVRAIRRTRIAIAIHEEEAP